MKAIHSHKHTEPLILQNSLADIVKKYPDKPALCHNDKTFTFAQMWDASLVIAQRLEALGIRAGDRVCLLSDNGCEAVIAFWATIQCNAINVFLNDQSPAAALQKILDDAEPAIIVVTRKLADSRLGEVQGYQHILLEELFDEASAIKFAKPQVGDSGGITVEKNNNDYIASIIYTSGSTGTPKGVCLTHTNLVSVGGMAADAYGTTAADSYLMVVPLHYIHGLMILMTMHLRGAAIHFMNSFMFPGAVTKKIQETQVTGFSGVPFHFTALVERGGLLEAELPHLRWMGVTGGTCPPERLQQIRQAQPKVELHISYGQTECSPRITALDPARIDRKPDSVGEIAEGLLVEFLDEAGQPVAPNSVGELVVSGPTVMHGYWNDPENTRRVIDELGRLHTGDLAYMDEEGDVFIKGRLQAMIKSAGERIFPEELEALLNAAPEVLDVAIVGTPDALYGQKVEAHIILEKGASDDVATAISCIKSYCLDHLPLVKTPKTYHLWHEFPLKANGKTDKQLLIQGSDSASQCYAVV